MKSTVARTATLIAVFFLAFILVAGVVRHVIALAGLGYSDHAVSGPREAARLRADVIFLGASQIGQGIDPEAFDDEFARYGKVRSFNLGIGGSSVPEQDPVLRKLFDAGACCVRYAIVHPPFMITEVAKGNTIRAIEHFNLSNALRYWSFLNQYEPAPPIPAFPLSGYAWAITLSTLQHYSNMGVGVRRPGTFDPGKHSGRGFAPSSRTMVDKKEIDIWREMLADMATNRVHFREELVSDAMFTKVIEIMQTIERHGARAIFVRPPGPWHWRIDEAFIRKFREVCPEGPPLLDFGDPVEYPDLYELANLYDAAHLNSSGAAIWGRLLAHKIGHLAEAGRLVTSAQCRPR